VVLEYVSSMKAAWEIAKAVKVSADAIDDAQIKLQVAELIGALADARISAAESAELIANLQAQLKSKTEMQFNGRLYYKINESNEKEGPWCPTCFDSKGLEVRLQPNSKDRYQDDWQCHVCTSYFGSST